MITFTKNNPDPNRPPQPHWLLVLWLIGIFALVGLKVFFPQQLNWKDIFLVGFLTYLAIDY